MRELSVYYCPKCGHYAYFQLSRNAVCPKCDVAMTHLDMRYQEFMNLNYQERDQLLSSEIIKTSKSMTVRLTLPAKKANHREVIAGLKTQIVELEEENERLQKNVTWMHDLLWSLIKKYKIADRSSITGGTELKDYNEFQKIEQL